MSKTFFSFVSCISVVSSVFCNTADGGGIQSADMQEVVITGSLIELQGNPISASQGVVTDAQLSSRPVLRTGELLEVVPGLVVTQHSGDGKANQYFLRGFNLDHGTDLATSVDGVPVNMPTHAHGQGYTDLNFVIPEFIQAIDYRKGTYYVDTGNFSAAGAVNMQYRSQLDHAFTTLEDGENGYRRALLGLSPRIGAGALLVGVEYATNDGPWVLPEGYRKVNGLAKYTYDEGGSIWSITAQGYDGHWHSTDQIPLRAVESGLIGRFGYIDPTDGGESYRYSLAGDWSTSSGMTNYRALLYAVDYRLDLFSNFTYALDPVHGDQFEQFDDRRIYGGEFSINRPIAFGLQSSINAGLQWRRDDIGKVALYLTQARHRYNTVREDSVVQSSYSAYASLDAKLSEFVRSVIGIRADRYDFFVHSDNLLNSGEASDSLASPKASFIFGPWVKTEFFLNAGRGFHSNDARGATITVDPSDGTPVERVTPLARAFGYDIGMRTALIPNAQVSITFYRLHLGSELVFEGDTGTTDASGATTRRGVEIGIVYNPIRWLIVDADAAFAHARFDEPVASGGDHIPNAVENVVSAGIAVNHPIGWTGGLRLRHFSGAPLVEDNSVRSSATTIVNVEVGYATRNGWKGRVGIYNVANRQDSDISYFYPSRLPSESVPVEDIHFHPVEPRTVRAAISVEF